MYFSYGIHYSKFDKNYENVPTHDRGTDTLLNNESESLTDDALKLMSSVDDDEEDTIWE